MSKPYGEPAPEAHRPSVIVVVHSGFDGGYDVILRVQGEVDVDVVVAEYSTPQPAYAHRDSVRAALASRRHF